MQIAGYVSLCFAGLLVLIAVVFQYNDHVRGYGTTMGGQMTTGTIWALSAICTGVSVGFFYHWLAALPTIVIFYVITAFVLRQALEKIMYRLHLGRD